MTWLISISCFLILLFIIILFTKVTITVFFKHSDKKDEQLKVKIRAWYGLLRYTIDIPVLKFNTSQASIDMEKEKKAGKENKEGSESKEKVTPDDAIKGIKDIKELTRHIVDLHQIVRKFLKHVKITKFEWVSEIGTGDAAGSGIAAGLGWSLKYSMFAVIDKYFTVKHEPVFHITPNFHRMCANTMLNGIFHFRIGHAILAGVRFVKYWKGSRPKFFNKPLSSLFGDNKNKSA
ncbi:DUF2953 domain-containing protein [Metabacillus sp. RGM 3146]|uniref:DUF2953 domain-containing protein n=1 Tax=Metabacillus sp. RGM 3146 TaxID=3401092 RepID=UPI003B9D3F9A